MKWISVKDRLPEKWAIFITRIGYVGSKVDGFYRILTFETFETSKGWKNFDDYGGQVEVTHWAEITPPKDTE